MEISERETRFIVHFIIVLQKSAIGIATWLWKTMFHVLIWSAFAHSLLLSKFNTSIRIMFTLFFHQLFRFKRTFRGCGTQVNLYRKMSEQENTENRWTWIWNILHPSVVCVCVFVEVARIVRLSLLSHICINELVFYILRFAYKEI